MYYYLYKIFMMASDIYFSQACKLFSYFLDISTYYLNLCRYAGGLEQSVCLRILMLRFLCLRILPDFMLVLSLYLCISQICIWNNNILFDKYVFIIRMTVRNMYRCYNIVEWMVSLAGHAAELRQLDRQRHRRRHLLARPPPPPAVRYAATSRPHLTPRVQA